MSCQRRKTEIFFSFLVLFLLLDGKFVFATNDKNNGRFVFPAIWKEIYGEYPNKEREVIPSQKKEVKEEKKISKGEAYVQKALRKNREIIRKQNEERKKREREEALSFKGEKSFTEEMKAKEKGFIKNAKTESKKTYENWTLERDQAYKEWALEKEKFLGRLKEVKENTFNFDEYQELMGARAHRLDLEAKAKKNGKNPPSIDEIKLDNDKYFVVDGAFDIPIKDQKNRPTCSAFAGIRALEILYFQKSGKQRSFSEQYFYFASKPKCQNDRCSKRGSWVIPGLERSKNHYKKDIPFAEDCPYNGSPISGNETQIPLPAGCQKGAIKVGTYSQVYHFDDIVISLSQNKPVIGGFKLTENFYVNDGLVTLKGAQDKNGKGNLDSHAGGHAILLIGYIQLPKEYKENEGRLCLLAANSWGEGHGQGGYTCLTEKWFNQYRFKMPFIVVEGLIGDKGKSF